MPKKLGPTTTLMLLTIWVLYVHQMAPSPMLGFIKEYYQIYNNDALLNLAASIIFPATIVACLYGSVLEQKLGTKNLFFLAMIFAALGLVANFVAESYCVFLLGRILYGLGFGLAIPFIGSAIMSWYSGKQRYFINTINGLYPFLGTVVAFGLMVPIYNFFGQSLKIAFGIWAIPVIVTLLIWNFLFDKQQKENPAPQSEAPPKEQGLYRNLLKQKNIRMLGISFCCDFISYSYIAIILPTYLYELSGISESLAGLLAAIAFPAVGILGGAMGGMLISKTGVRKPTMAAGQLLKLCGGMLAALGSTMSLGVVMCGVVLYGLGNSLWIPGMYTVPTEMEGMNSTRVAASFSLISSCGFVMGFIGPIIGGWLTNHFMLISGIADPIVSHVFGLRWSLFIYSLVNLLAFFCILRMTETGPKAKKKAPSPV